MSGSGRGLISGTVPVFVGSSGRNLRKATGLLVSGLSFETGASEIRGHACCNGVAISKDIGSNIIIIIIIIIIISFMQGIYTYISETKCVPREYSVAVILLLLFMVLISLVSVLNLLNFYISTSRNMCAVSNMAVFWSSLTSCFPGMLLTYFLNDFKTAPVAPIITGITFVFTFHMRCISIVKSFYF